MPGRRDVPEGLLAWAQPSRTDGTFLTDGAGRPKVRRVLLRRAEPGPPTRPPGLLSDTDWSWATSAPRRWSSALGRLADRAETVALSLARHGCVALDHDFRDGAIAHLPRGWTPDARLHREHADRRQHHRQQRSTLAEDAQRLHQLLAQEWPGVAASLALPDHDPRLEWIVWAAEDLAAGRTHDSVRAFAQIHTNDTKARDDLPQMLRAVGWEPEALSMLGVSRSPYLGVGGPIQAQGGDHLLDFTGWPGPHDLRLPPGSPITVHVVSRLDVLLVIENRQAAEAICDIHPDLPVIWCHGQPSQAALDLITQAAGGVSKVLICPDADLGGARIAARIHDQIPAHIQRVIIDAGAGEHPSGPPFGPTTLAHLRRLADRDDAVGAFAQSCLARGYAVEQEAALRAAVRKALADARHG
jgi:hypothetical protein